MMKWTRYVPGVWDIHGELCTPEGDISGQGRNTEIREEGDKGAKGKRKSRKQSRDEYTKETGFCMIGHGN